MKKNIFDCFLYDGEKELLKLRLHLNFNYVYKFVLVQSKLSFQGNKSNKELITLEEILSWNKELKSKIVIINLKKNDFIEAKIPSEREIISRGAFERAFKKVSDDDFIMISDVDEIIDCKKLINTRLNKNYIFRLNLYFTYFSSNNLCISAPWWGAPILLSFDLFKKNNLDISRLRQVGKLKTKIPYYINEKNLYYVGIHLSFLGGYKAALRKLKRYSDSPIKLEKFSFDYYLHKINTGEDIFNRRLIWSIVNKDIFLLNKRLLNIVYKAPFYDQNFTKDQKSNKLSLKIYIRFLTFSDNFIYRKILFLIYKNIFFESILSI